MDDNRLPYEILLRIFRFLEQLDDRTSPEYIVSNMSRAVQPCALVCRHWTRPAQQVLFGEVYLPSLACLAKFHSSLSTLHSTVGKLVRTLSLPLLNPTPPGGQLEPSRLLAECLSHTIHLEELSFGFTSSSLATNFVVQRMCFLLPKLTRLTFCNARNVGDGAEFDPELLLDLPKTITDLTIWSPSSRLIQVLPEIVANLNRPLLSTSHIVPTGPDLSVKNQSKSTTGLTSFALHLQPPNYQLDPHIAKIAPLLTSTLTSLTLQADPRSDTLTLVKFLSATPLLEHLGLWDISFSSDLFSRLHPLIHLQSLQIQVSREHSPDWVEVCPSFGTFISLSPHLSSIKVHGDPHDKRPVSPVIDVILASTTSKLRRMHLHDFETVSKESLRRLMRSAPQLEYLAIGLPKGSLACLISSDHLKDVINA